MRATLFLGLVGAAKVLCQSPYASTFGSPSFRYWGCAAVNMTAFGPPIAFPGGQLTHEACQRACEGNLFAAIFPDACRCGNNARAVTPLDEKYCNYPCSKDPNSEICGGICPDHNRNITTLFTSNLLEQPVEDPVSMPGPGSPVAASVSLPLPSDNPIPTELPSLTVPPVTTLPSSTSQSPSVSEVVTLSTRHTSTHSTTTEPQFTTQRFGDPEASSFSTARTSNTASTTSAHVQPSSTESRVDGDPPAPVQVAGADYQYFGMSRLSALGVLVLLIL